MEKYWIHTSKSDKSDEIHSQWISTLSEGVIVMYSDGSKSNSGHTGAGWAIFKMEREGLMSHVVQGLCYIGTQSEVYDAELHAIAEGLQQISQTGVTPGKMYIYINNQAAIDTLWDNKLNSEPTRHAIKQANILKAQGRNTLTVWAPARQGIPGNKLADKLAKTGTEPTNTLCGHTCTTRTCMLLGYWQKAGVETME
jgi:ribonuclease HI